MPYVPPHRRRAAGSGGGAGSTVEGTTAEAPVNRALAAAAGGGGGGVRAESAAVRPLLILDVNGVLVCRKPWGSRGGSGSQYRLRRHCNDFVRFCFEHFAVGVWSCGMRETLTAELGEIEAFSGRGRLGERLVFVWSQEQSTNLWPRHSEVSEQKPLFLKEIEKVWAACGGSWGLHNTVLVDDHLEKFERNPLGSSVVVPAFQEGDEDDDCLGADGELVQWLLQIAKAEDTAAMVRSSDSPMFPVAYPEPPLSSEPEPEPDQAEQPEQSGGEQ